MFKSSGSFDRALEKATSQLLLEPDWDSILQICDSVRQADIQPKYAINAIKKKISVENPHVSLYALQVMEAIIKNCGSMIHDEVATKDFMDFIKEILKKKGDTVKQKLLELIQIWSHAFRHQPKYAIVQNTYDLLKMEGYTFPKLCESDAMFSAEAAPEWKDGETCNRCRVSFSTFQRKHHCRNCGHVFCAKCSAKQAIIPKFGLEREVRVCDSCHDNLNKTRSGENETDLPAEYLASPLSQQPQVPVKKTDQELQEEEELQLAMALSQSEEEAKKKDKNKTNVSKNSNLKANQNELPKATAVTPTMIDTSDMDPELARYLNRNYWEQKAPAGSGVATTQPSAPVALTTEPKVSPAKVAERLQNCSPSGGGVEGGAGGAGSEGDETVFLAALHSSIEIFMNRMASNSQRGRSIANDSSVQTLFMTLTAMHPRLITDTQQQENTRAHFERLQDKLTQLKDAREALDVLRAEQVERRRREREEQERQRQIQMAQTLGVLRQKKQEYLEYQRQLALQRTQEHEMEMHMRTEQQKQMQLMRAMQYSSGFPIQQPQQQLQQPQQQQPAMTSPQHQAYGVAAPYAVAGGGSPLHHPYAPPAGMPGVAPGVAPGQPQTVYYPGQYPGYPAGYMQAAGPPQGQPGAMLQGQPGAMPQMQPGAVPQGQPGAMPQGQPGTVPQMQPGAVPQGMAGPTMAPGPAGPTVVMSPQTQTGPMPSQAQPGTVPASSMQPGVGVQSTQPYMQQAAMPQQPQSVQYAPPTATQAVQQQQQVAPEQQQQPQQQQHPEQRQDQSLISFD